MDVRTATRARATAAPCASRFAWSLPCATGGALTPAAPAPLSLDGPFSHLEDRTQSSRSDSLPYRVAPAQYCLFESHQVGIPFTQLTPTDCVTGFDRLTMVS